MTCLQFESIFDQKETKTYFFRRFQQFLLIIAGIFAEKLSFSGENCLTLSQTQKKSQNICDNKKKRYFCSSSKLGLFLIRS